MRLHSLEITAFGPFAESVEVDLDALSEAGLFLLTGPTGAGKSSVLDAVCFALYGDVPGERGRAKRFRCDTAAAGLAPRVVLEATLAGRRFRLSRSPQWVRPKKRGSGTTNEPARVLVEEHSSGEWVLLTNRMDEAGQLVTDLLGMTMPQFCQVAMLPQGRFQAFLRARSEERHTLLQQLFSTQRFEDIEKWLREHTRRLHRESLTHHQTVSDTVSRLLEAADTRLPEEWPQETADDLTPVARSGQLAGWSGELAHEAATKATEAAERAATAARAATSCREERDAARRTIELQRRRTTATAELTDLQSEAEEHEARSVRLSRARRAAPIRPLHAYAHGRASERDRAAAEAAPASTASRRLLDGDSPFDRPSADATDEDLHALSDERLAAALAQARDTRATITSMAPRHAELGRLQETITEDETALARLTEQVETCRQRIEGLPARIDTLRAQRDEAQHAASRAESLRTRIDELDARLDAHHRLDRLRQESEDANKELREGIDLCQRLKESWLELREARLEGMAGEIATDLAVGACCPVCGSAEHPHKAEPAPGTPSASREKQARRELDTAEATRVALDDKAREISLRLAVVETEAGQCDAADAEAERERLRADHADARSVAQTLPETETALARTSQSLECAHQQHTDRSAELATVQTRLTATRATAEEIQTELDGLLSGSGHETLEAFQHELDLTVETHAETQRLRRAWDAAVSAALDADRALDDWVDEHGFATVQEALDVSLPEDELDELATRVRSHEDRVTKARATLEDPEIEAVADVEPPDLVAMDHDLTRLEKEGDAARTHAHLLERRTKRLSRLHDELDAALDAWTPAREDHATAAELAAFVEGKSHDNELRMRLSAYVLAWRLAQVVAAANERLLWMSDQRYTLEHTGRRGAGETRGGLSLLVRDEWSGDTRDPATLSGGETFVVSLALALGLADVVTREAGGSELDTLFVDEGFGALDPETLEDVMDTLDTLRDGGRVVGVVSHVTEMRSRIPMQLTVTKARDGSTLTVSRLDE